MLTPAAQYLRMSTDQQQYSLTNQAAAIAQYAERYGFNVVSTYKDEGRSGLRAKNRLGLMALLRDVLAGSAEYKAILVYDVSRWGRFQDIDEAAHYEFLCRSKGIPVHYCAEQFGNDTALPNAILKSLKRSMAAEYSRELSVRTYAGLRRAAEEGFWTGSIAGYGFRRVLIGADGCIKQVMQDGEQKNLRTDRVRLVLGPPAEVKIVRWIYKMLVEHGLRPAEIVRELARRGVMYYGRPWSFYTVRQVLTHPKFCGVLVWGRTESKLRNAPKRSEPELWITATVRGPQIVDEQTFAKAQQAFHSRTQDKTNAELLDALRALWLQSGCLSEHLIDTSPVTPSVNTYRGRFGRLSTALELIGYRQPTARIQRQRLKSRHDSRRLRLRLIRRLSQLYPGLLEPAHYAGHIHCRALQVDVVVSVCRKDVDFTRPFWWVSPRQFQDSAVTLLCLLDDENKTAEKMYVIPRMRAGHGFRVAESSEILSQAIKVSGASGVYAAVSRAKAMLSNSPRPEPELLIGTPQIAHYLGISLGVAWRLIRHGLPVDRKGRRIVISPERLNGWVQANGIAWVPTRDRFGRFVRQSVSDPICAGSA